MALADASGRLRGRPRTAKYSGTYEVLGDVELSPEEDAAARRQIAQADKERDEVAVTFRWGQKQLAIVRRAAQLPGIPYQTYLKDAVMRQAVADLNAAASAGLDTMGPSPIGTSATATEIVNQMIEHGVLKEAGPEVLAELLERLNQERTELKRKADAHRQPPD